MALQPPFTAPPFTPPPRPAQSEAEVITAFIQAIADKGIAIPTQPIKADGSPQRFSTKRGRPRDDAGFYACHFAPPNSWGIFSDHRTMPQGEFHVWRERAISSLSPEERSQAAAQMDQARRLFEQDRRERSQKAIEKARRLLDAAAPAVAHHPYFLRKGVSEPPPNAFELSIFRITEIIGYSPQSSGEPLAGESILIFPVSNIGGELAGIEFIGECGRKTALSGTVKKGRCWIPEPVQPGANILAIGEGIATVWSVHEATGWPVIAGLSGGNLPDIARQVRDRHPGLTVVILADVDGETRKPNQYAVDAATEIGGRLAVPKLSSEAGSDWNDHWLVYGPEATREALQAAIPLTPSQPPTDNPTPAISPSQASKSPTATTPDHQHPSITAANLLRESYALTAAIEDPLARLLELKLLAKAHQIGSATDSIERLLEQAEKSERRIYPRPVNLTGFTSSEWERESSSLTPTCIIQNYLFADVGTLCAAGGVGKSTLLLYESVHIITGRPLYGLEVKTPGCVLFVTVEDPRNVILARLHQVMRAIDPPLTPDEITAIDNGFAIWDLSGEMARLVDADNTGRIVATGFADSIIQSAGSLGHVSLIVLDPLAGLHGQSVLNDTERSLITECRHIVHKLGCTVRLVHHTGQMAARSGTLDQYAGRGGSSLADGSRMVAVLAPHHPGGNDSPPATLTVNPGDSILKLARPKLSYSPPQPLIWIARSGFRFNWAMDTPAILPEHRLSADCDQVERFLRSELTQGRKHTRTTLDAARATLSMSRDSLRRALAELDVSQRIRDEPLPESERIGGKKTYLLPVGLNREGGRP